MANIQVEIGLKDSGYSEGVENAKKQLEKLNREHGITNGKLQNVNKQYSSAKRLLTDCTLAYSRLSDEAKKSDYGKGLKQIIDNSKQAVKELNQVKNKVKEVMNEGSKGGKGGGNSDILSTIGSKLSGTGGIIGQLGGGMEQLGSIMGGSLTMGAAAATAGIAAAGVAAEKLVDVSKEAIQKSSEFGRSLSELGAITGLRGDDLSNLRGQIQDLGKETNTSVVDVANGMAKIGGAMPQLLDDTKGLGEMFKQSSTLAKAGVMSQEDAVEALTTIMGQYSHSVKDAKNDVDILANASQSGSAEISDLAATIKVAGVAAASGGLSLQQTAAMAEVLGDKALKGSEAGTQLRNVFSKFSAEGIKDADTMMQTLAQHAGDTAWMVKQFGLDSAKAAAVLAEGGKRYKELLEDMNKKGTADSMAKENENNLQSQIKNLKTQWNNFLASFNVDKMNAPLRILVQSLGELVTATSQLFDTFKNSSTVEAALEGMGAQGKYLVNILTTIVDVVGDVLGVFFDLVDTSKSAETSFNAVTLVFKLFNEVLEGIKMTVFTLRLAIHKMLEKFKELRAEALAYVSKIPLFEEIKSCIEWAMRMIDKVINKWDELKGKIAKAREGFYKEENGGKEPSFEQQTLKSIDYAKDKASKEGTQEAKQKMYIKTLQKGIDFERKRLKLAKTDYQRKQIQTRINTYEEAKNTNPFHTSSTITTSSVGKITTPSKTNNTDRIGQAENSYVETIKGLDAAVKDSMITTREYNQKKKSALESLIAAYHNEGKTSADSPRLSSLIGDLGNLKENIHNDDLNEVEKEYQNSIKQADDELLSKLITDEEYNKKVNDAQNNYAKKLIELGNLTDNAKKNLDFTLKDIGERNMQEGTKDFNEGVKNILTPKKSLGDDILPSKKDTETRYRELIEQYDDLLNYIEKNQPRVGIDIKEEDFNKAKEELSTISEEAKKAAKKIQDKKKFNLTVEGLQDITFLGDSLSGLEDAFDSCKTAWDYFSTAINEGISIIQTAMDAYSTFKEIIDMIGAAKQAEAAKSAAASATEVAATQSEVAATGGKVAADQAASISETTKQGSKLPFPANLAAIAAGIAAVVAAFAMIGNFANGGIIGGRATHGDMQLARVNGGELILNGTQQARLFDLLNEGGILANGGVVEFKLRGSDLYGSLKNYGKVKSKSGKILKI